MTTPKHRKNGMVQTGVNLKTGYDVLVTIVTGIDGETIHLLVTDNNLYDDDDERSNRPKEHIIPFATIKELENLRGMIGVAIRERNRTLKR